MEKEKELNAELNKELNKELDVPLDKDLNETIEEEKECTEEIAEKIKEKFDEIKEESEAEEKQETESEEKKEQGNEAEEKEKGNENKEKHENEAEEKEQKIEEKEEGNKPKDKKDYLAEEKEIEKSRQLVEAILFMSPQPIPLKEIAKICETNDLQLISELIEAIKKDLIERKSGIEIIRETEGYRMQVLQELEVKVAHLAGPTRFSKGVMKTMAYIAFKQPVKQSTIIKYRTNKAYDEIKILEEQGFITREKAGITYVIKTTKKFLQYFGDNAIKLKKNPEFEG